MGCTVRNRTWECCILCLLNLCMAVQVPSTLEIGLVPALPRGQYPGLFLMSSPARMVRPVLNLSTHTTETIGSFETGAQYVSWCIMHVYMDVDQSLQKRVEQSPRPASVCKCMYIQRGYTTCTYMNVLALYPS